MIISTGDMPIQQEAQQKNLAVQIVGWFCLQYLCLKVLGRTPWLKTITLVTFLPH